MTVSQNPDNKTQAPSAPVNGDLIKRVASSIILAPSALGATYLGGQAFAAVIAFAAILMLYEWARMIEGEAFSTGFFALAAAGAAAMFCAAGGWFAAAFGFCAAAALGAGLASHGGSKRHLWAAFGGLYIIAPCVALIWLRDVVENGRALTFTLFAIVWMADMGAYFAGRFIGGPRISQALSPEKTWMGVAGGVVMGGLAGAAAVAWIYGEGAMVTFVAIGASLGLASILGDLAESAFKRIFGVKDTSNLIPGHGGVLDRLDGMIFATTAMTAVIFLHMIIGKL